MKIQTSKGEQELTAEMVCKGMVLSDGRGEVAVLLGRFEDYTHLWSVKGWAANDSTPPLAPCWVECLGCDPTIASREACERYGVHGDAAAHGFARLRDGGAVDLRNPENIVRGMVFVDTEHGERYVVEFSDQRDEIAGNHAMRFVGLDAGCAPFAEDVRRLCCGASAPLERGRSIHRRCTLAIGDHDTHEDLATGVKWSAKPGANGCSSAIANIRARLDSADIHFDGSPGALRSLLAACDLRGEVHRLAPGAYRVTLDRADSVLCQTLTGWLEDNSPTRAVFDVVSTLSGLDSGCNPEMCGHAEATTQEALAAAMTPIVRAALGPAHKVEQSAEGLTVTFGNGFRFNGSGDLYPNWLPQTISGDAGGLYVPAPPAPSCGRCAKPVDNVGPCGPVLLCLPVGDRKAEAPICGACLSEVNEDVGAWTIREGKIERKAPCPHCGGDDAICRGSLAGLKACAAKGKPRIRIGRQEWPCAATHEAANGQWLVRFAVSVTDWNVCRQMIYQGNADAARLSLIENIPCRVVECALTAREHFLDVSLRLVPACRVYAVRVSAGLDRAREAFQKIADASAAAASAVADMPEPPGGWRTPEQIDREVAERGRRNREAALVALVNAVPDGLDPIGWRAAVLACVEHRNGNASDVKTETFYYALLRAHHRAARGETKNRLFISCGNPFECAVDSYLRAITPAPPVPRVRATWKTRGPVLPVDDGRDDR